MRKTQKQIFGFFGLAFVVAMTFLAAIIPTPEASATDGSVTDKLVIKVINEDGNPHVTIISPEDKLETYEDSVDFTIDYNSAEKSFLDITFTGQNANGTDKAPVVLTDYAAYDLDFSAGQMTTVVDLMNHGTVELGYGKFVFSLRDIGIAGVEVPGQVISILHTPVVADTNGDWKEDGSTDATIDFGTTEEHIDPDDPASPTKTVPTTVGKIEVEIYGPNGEKVYGPVSYDTTKLIDKDGNIKPINLPFGDFANETGDYKIAFTAYDKEDNYMYTFFGTKYYIFTPAPDTGAFFQDLNISKEDYLITGLLIFFVFSVVGIGIVARDRKGRSASKRR